MTVAGEATVEVINGNFGQEKSNLPLGEMVSEAIQVAELGDVENARFFMVVEWEDQIRFLTNEQAPAEAVLMLEIVKQAIVGSV